MLQMWLIHVNNFDVKKKIWKVSDPVLAVAFLAVAMDNELPIC